MLWTLPKANQRDIVSKIDPYCINEANNTELSKAVNSMFRWYRRANKCCMYARVQNQAQAEP
jgi:hypothetical protein